jgi:glycosyltransferase involved in cell wall biosynthesis
MEAHAAVDGSFHRRANAPRSVVAAAGFALQLLGSFAGLAWKFFRLPAADAVIVGHPGYFHVHFARLLCRLSRRRPRLVYDSFIPLVDAIVNDRRLIPPAGRTARLLHAFEAACLRSADVCLVDTEAQRRYLAREFSLPPEKLCCVRVGPTIRPVFPRPAATEAKEAFRVVFVGTFIPLQGIEVIIEAALRLRGRASIVFRIVGSGQMEASMRRLAARGGADNLEFTGWVETERLGALLRKHDLALGVFGNTAKAGRVIPSKVYDVCAAGLPFITADTPAIREVFTHLLDAYLVPAGDPDALAAAILRLQEDPTLRRRLASGAFEIGRTRFSP